MIANNVYLRQKKRMVCECWTKTVHVCIYYNAFCMLMVTFHYTDYAFRLLLNGKNEKRNWNRQQFLKQKQSVLIWKRSMTVVRNQWTYAWLRWQHNNETHISDLSDSSCPVFGLLSVACTCLNRFTIEHNWFKIDKTGKRLIRLVSPF